MGKPTKGEWIHIEHALGCPRLMTGECYCRAERLQKEVGDLDPNKLGAFLEACEEVKRDLSGRSHNGFVDVGAGKADDSLAAYSALVGGTR